MDFPEFVENREHFHLFPLKNSTHDIYFSQSGLNFCFLEILSIKAVPEKDYLRNGEYKWIY